MPGSRSQQEPVYVTAAQKEKLGYEQPESMANPKVQRTAVEHREEIYAAVKPFVEEALGGREVELGDISAPYPYPSVNVSYRTVDEPIVASYAMVGVGDIEESKVGGIQRIELGEVRINTVSGLLLMAYRSELTAIGEYLETSYPDYVPQPEGYARAFDEADRQFSVEFDTLGNGPTVEERAAMAAATERIYGAYLENPHRSDAQWRKLIDTEAEGLPLRIGITLMTKSPEKSPDALILDRLGEDMKTNSVFERFATYTIHLDSNLRVRDSWTINERYESWYDPSKNVWHRFHTVNGGSVEP